MPIRFALFGLIAIAARAHASWTVAQADTPAAAIHDAQMVQVEVGQRLAINDIVETPSNAGMQIQDETGENVLALGPGTRVLLARDAHIALLRGWIKALHACSAAVNCAAPVVDTERGRYTLGNHATIVVASSPPGYDDADAVFCESGSVSALSLPNAHGRLAAVQLSAGQFAARRASSPSMIEASRPDGAFLAAMPVAFRDELRALSPAPVAHDKPSGTARPVAYDDVSDWLQSSLTVRTQPGTRFTDRFRVRLSDPAFRRDVDAHLGTLPEWRVLLHPPAPRIVPSATPRSPASSVPPVYRSLFLRP
ncbi:hypothetical protein [Paraburkholderia humisilvae]|nr:hypothetical protein [Paraburkholderia humisilvae]